MRLPRGVAEDAGLEAGSVVDLRVVGGRLVAERRSPEYRLEDLVREILPKNRHREVDWGGPVGDEIW